MGQDSAFVSGKHISGWFIGDRNVSQIDRSAHAANISVAVKLRAAKTAMQALIAEISPWMLDIYNQCVVRIIRS